MEVTIYVGKYKVPKNGVIPMPKTARLRVLSHHIGINENGEPLLDDRLTITVEDENFWSVIIKLEDYEATRFVQALKEAMKHRQTGSLEQESYTL